MKLLLDTHIWLWSLLDPDRLSRRARRELTEPANTLALSPVSVWEALVLAETGRVLLKPDPWSWIRTALTVRPMTEIPLTFDIAFGSRSIRLDHGDPADRFIAATAMVHDLTLVTADASLLACPDIKAMPGV
ncbi:MAG: type II toxin-antitoxin system VapC family toxin [Gemmatimonadota bacterium]|uniref:type II toxin-antitoxin system VapC family toxin n=1 Tax=Candidatus Palauibacter scopulicola TaxID=3056741 RepID=UPI0023A4ABAF|nr:type II toxin-antitoxin system VapC family toxin [Candidatus Palauibacter scopulicola]MDE2662402.1 type II toxin-antitoxin system VapC family toxin [Candidatus Palauibacter scopulicola]